MTQEALFVQLSHRLRNYGDTCFLMLLLNWGLDQDKFACSLAQVSRSELGGLMTRHELRHAVERLQNAGLIQVLTYPNTKTEFRVNREAVLELLRQPIPSRPYFPGAANRPIPFLSAWAEDQARLEQGPAAAVSTNN